MSLFPSKEIHLQSSITPAEFRKRLSMFVEPGAAEGTTPEFKGDVKESVFDLKYLLQPSYVRGEVVENEYGADIDITVSLSRRYDFMMTFCYALFASAVFLISFSLIGSIKFGRPITASGLLTSVLWFTPSAVVYCVCKSLLDQAAKFNELFFESLLRSPYGMGLFNDPR